MDQRNSNLMMLPFFFKKEDVMVFSVFCMQNKTDLFYFQFRRNILKNYSLHSQTSQNHFLTLSPQQSPPSKPLASSFKQSSQYESPIQYSGQKFSVWPQVSEVVDQEELEDEDEDQVRSSISYSFIN